MKVNLLIPYFGEFPPYFQLFLNSCRENADFQWTIITDNHKPYAYPPNVRTIYDTFSNVRERFQSRFDFRLALDTPYKLCDYKPAYGFLFPELLDGYDFWGYCDMDVIYGQLGRVITSELLRSFPKVFTLGHFTLIKNEKRYNEMFLCPLRGRLLYRDAFSSPDIFHFDEDFIGFPNINDIFRQESVPVMETAEIADIYVKSPRFRLARGVDAEKPKKSFFVWNRGRLFRKTLADGAVKTEEYLYIHLQKRSMALRFPDAEREIYKIIPDSFDPLEVPFHEIETRFGEICLSHPFPAALHYIRLRARNLKVKASRKFRKGGEAH